jgi:uncharacterized surface protein with fasciclin (FAS1) repeats
MRLTTHTQITKQLAVIIGVGAGILFGTPTIAQQYSNPSQNPAGSSNQMQQPSMNDQMQQPSMDQTNPPASSGNIVAIASGNQNFNTLTQAIQAAGLAETLSGQGPYTVFAPTEEAFAQLPNGTLQFLLQPENRDLLRQVLTYHVVEGEVPASQIETGVVEAMGGGLAVRVTPDNRVIVNNASVTQADIQASNGVIHVVNRVLLPESLQRRLASQLGVQQIYR